MTSEPPTKEKPEANNEGKPYNSKEGNEVPEKTWIGYFDTRSQKWWCDCDPPQRATCKTVVRNGANHGRKFWVCLKSKEKQCPFWVWVDEENKARAWLVKNGRPLNVQETPSKAGDLGFQVPNDVTPWSLSKRKPVPREVPNGQGNSDWDGSVASDDEVGMESPSRKAAKRHLGATASASTYHQELQRTLALPTPKTDGMSTKACGQLPAFDPSGQLSQKFEEVIDLTEFDVTERVLKLIAEEGVRLKASTTLQIRHEIELEADITSVKLRKNEQTLTRALKRIDELEEMHSQNTRRINMLEETVSHLTGLSDSQASGIYEE